MEKFSENALTQENGNNEINLKVCHDAYSGIQPHLQSKFRMQYTGSSIAENTSLDDEDLDFGNIFSRLKFFFDFIRGASR